MVTKIKNLPLIPRVASVFAAQAGDNDSFKDSERRRPDHQALAAAFSADHKVAPVTPGSSNSPATIVTLSAITASNDVVLTYSYDPAKKAVRLTKFPC